MMLNKIHHPLILRSLFYLLLIVPLVNCNEKAMTEETIETDLSVASIENEIHWVDATDLNQKLENSLRYHYGLASESDTEKHKIYQGDTTQVTASINFKTASKSTYTDTNPLNNSVTIPLIKEHVTPNPQSVVLRADGNGNTYDLITSVLAPGNNPIETPDCNHIDFGEHIDEIFDTELNKPVFRFFIHTRPDNDRCINFDRQRNEIKTYDKSPDHLLGVENETVVYTWKFKLESGFQSSPNFTHIHQIKSVGGALASMPMYTLTTRKGTPDILQLRYAETDSQRTLAETNLAPFVGHWIDVEETVKYGESGTYNMVLKKVSDQSILFEYSNNAIINWRPGGTFVRPKWGVYRSLDNAQDLRDEEVLFADFSITEIQ